jgi:hypothetical protein
MSDANEVLKSTLQLIRPVKNHHDARTIRQFHEMMNRFSAFGVAARWHRSLPLDGLLVRTALAGLRQRRIDRKYR